MSDVCIYEQIYATDENVKNFAFIHTRVHLVDIK